ncbi:MAG: hypothetical protein ACM3U2_24260 [Deltaproteobacteria bacterium]
MTRAFNYDVLLKCVSGLIFAAVITVVVAETDLLPPGVRHPMRASIRQAGEKVTRIPAVADLLRKVGY